MVIYLPECSDYQIWYIKDLASNCGSEQLRNAKPGATGGSSTNIGDNSAIMGWDTNIPL